MRNKKKGGQKAALFDFAALERLELELGSKLNLAFPEQSAVSELNALKRRVKGQALCEPGWAATGRIIVKRALNTGDLSAIEGVEDFAPDFEVGALCKLKAA